MLNNPKPDLVMDLINTLESLRRHQWHEEKPLPIRHSEMMLLMCLCHNLRPGRLGVQPSELGDLMDVTRPTITAMVNSLEKQGYVQRLNDDSDRRVVFVRPTKKGEQLVEKAREHFEDTMAEMVEYFGQEDSQELIRLISKARDFVEYKKTKRDRRTEG